jgi:hypothetical protein
MPADKDRADDAKALALKACREAFNALLVETLLTVRPHETGGDPCCEDALSSMEDFEESLALHGVELMPLGEAIFQYAKACYVPPTDETAEAQR